MRDVIWTLIAVWLVMKIVDWMKDKRVQKAVQPPVTKSAPQKNNSRLDTEGEYVDFEEL